MDEITKHVKSLSEGEIRELLDADIISDEGVKKIFEITNSIITGSHFVYAKKEDGWYHGTDYVNKDAIYPHVLALHLLCRKIARHFRYANIEVVIGPTIGGVGIAQIVAFYMILDQMALSGIHGITEQIKAIYADEEPVYEEVKELIDRGVESEIEGVLPVISLKSEGPVTIEYAYNGHPLFAIYKKKIGTKRVFRRGYDKLVKGKRCLIVEDVVSSGGTVDKTCQATKLLGGIVVAVAALADRSKGKVTKETLGVDDYYVLLRVLMEMEKEEKCRKCREEGFESVRTDLGKGNEFLQRKGLI